MAIKIKIKYNESHISSISAKGHAGFAKAGYDIVCSAASTLLQTAVTGIESVVNKDDFYEYKDGFLSFIVPPISDKTMYSNINFLLDTIAVALLEIEKQYPACLRIYKCYNRNKSGKP